MMARVHSHLERCLPLYIVCLLTISMPAKLITHLLRCFRFWCRLPFRWFAQQSLILTRFSTIPGHTLNYFAALLVLFTGADIGSRLAAPDTVFSPTV